jgi:tetratricopeptide (TPR) repeat protein
MAHRQAGLIAVALLVLPVPAPLHAQRQTPESVDALYRWANAVNRHVPGSPDAAVQFVATMTYGGRVELNASFSYFIRVLNQEPLKPRNDLEDRLTAFARTVGGRPGAATFLKRAAILHADAVVFGGRFPAPFENAPTASSSRSPLLSNERMTVARDGEVVGTAQVNWHLPFARSLLDVLLKQEPARASSPVPREHYEFASGWYHAVAAYLFARGLNADATGHLRQAARVLPDDALVLFDRATYAEAFGLPIYQAVDDGGVPSEGRTNSEAERLYRRALEVDPAYVEARVRLARLLDHRGRHDEAAAEIAAALEARPYGVTAFYAYIVAGRIAAARGRHEDALRSYRLASALYDRAQSALLGASHAALMMSDVPQAMTPLAMLGGGTGFGKEDPWLDYHLGAGRDATPLLQALWARASE